MKKVLVKAYIATNLGDDLFLKILRDRYPNVQFTLIGDRRDGIYGQFKSYRLLTQVSQLVRRLLLLISKSISEKFTNIVITKRLNSASRHYDASLLLGGSMFIQNKKHFTTDDVIKLQCLESFKHAFIIGANFGPYIEERYLFRYKDAFAKCDSISFRDRLSYETLGSVANSNYLPDVVFQLKHPRKKIVPNSVGISVIDLTRRGELAQHTEGYIDFLISLTEQLVKVGKNVYLFSFCKEEGDDDAISQITESVSNDLEVISYGGNIESFLDIYSSMESMYCTRFHSMVLSLIYSQNMVPIIYSKKMIQVLVDIDYIGNTIDINEIEAVNVNEAVEMLNDYSFILSSAVRSKSEEMFKKLDEFLLLNN